MSIVFGRTKRPNQKVEIASLDLCRVAMSKINVHFYMNIFLLWTNSLHGDL